MGALVGSGARGRIGARTTGGLGVDRHTARRHVDAGQGEDYPISAYPGTWPVK